VSRRAIAVMSLALLATSLTRTGHADTAATAPTAAAALTDPPTPPPAANAVPAVPVDAKVTSTPLATRPSKPLALEPTPETPGNGWKALGIVVALAAGFFLWRRQRVARVVQGPLPELRILRRTAVAVRSELLLVEIEGQRLLLGVTPNAIQNLYIFPETEVAEEPALTATPTSTTASAVEDVDVTPTQLTFARRLAGVLAANDEKKTATKPAPSAPPPAMPRAASGPPPAAPRAPRKPRAAARSARTVDDAVEGQAAGLRSVGRRP